MVPFGTHLAKRIAWGSHYKKVAVTIHRTTKASLMVVTTTGFAFKLGLHSVVPVGYFMAMICLSEDPESFIGF